jgi:hypothetical protein
MSEPTPACFLSHFSALQDPRQAGKVLYPLGEILLLMLCATIAGAQGKRMIEFYSPMGPAFGLHSSNERGSLRLVRSHSA